ncbi:MAG: FtsW/RodA/SpoVE family cell cycle protein [Bryobacterales bacterium]|nr:FtsW/RodA/SpoVE family cell cycle protein [Bryobacterales bacterium]
MTTTRVDRTILARQRRDRERREGAGLRRRELVLLLAASLVSIGALFLVFRAQIGRLEDYQADIAQGRILTLDRNTQPERIARQLRVLEEPQDREFAAQRIRQIIQRDKGLSNIGAIGRITVNANDMAGHRNLVELPRRVEAATERAERLEKERLARRGWYGKLRDWMKEKIFDPDPRTVRVPLLTAQQLAAFKPMVAVRNAADFRNSFLLWCGVYLLSFYAAHLFWRIRGFAGDNTLLPLVHLLTGLGLALMVSLRDPIRDTLIFRDFAQGVAVGCVIMVVASLWDWDEIRRFAFLPLIGALVLAVLLFVFGTGPAGSDAKVNLFGLQPVEAIRILLVMFLAGYFGRNWDVLREMRQQSGPLSSLARLLHVARFDYTLPVFGGVAVAMLLFFMLRDMGPGLVIGCLFLALYSVARNSFRLAFVGLSLILMGFLTGYWTGEPATVRDRVDMWLSIWDNSARGGDQVAHSLWALSTGAATGTGLGLGYPQSIPAGHTDLILSVFGEQFGYIGFVLLFVAFGALVYRSLRIALRAPSPYTFFLVLGLTLITAFQLALIAGGILGLAPLAGVVTPYLSYGRSSMLANFALLGIVIGVSALPAREQATAFGKPAMRLARLLALAGLAILVRAGWYQTVRADHTLLRGSLALNADGVRRYAYNPRISAAARLIPKGDIYDRNGLPLATSDFTKVEANKAKYEALGVRLEQTTAFLDRRHYPLGPQMFYVLGDTRTALKRGARNTAFEESRSRLRLQGFDDGIEVEEFRDDEGDIERRLKFDYRELLPLIRHRWEPEHPQVKELMARPRDVKMSIDSRLQMRVSAIVERHLKRLKRDRAAVVVLDVATGDLLASVSHPWPTLAQIAPLQGGPQTPVREELLLDRARYGLYPPGSSFKLVTAIAALRKDPNLIDQKHNCGRLPDGRVGATIPGQTRPIRDDIQDRVPHGSVDMAKGIVVSCNAYFAQLGHLEVGADGLFDTARIFGIAVANPNTAKELNKYLPQSSYGQGEVVASPFQMARVAATVAAGGRMPYGRWILDESNPRTEEPRALIAPELAQRLGVAMRGVVTQGTGRSAATNAIAIAGKTGTAELARGRRSHGWFIGYAPFGDAPKKIAFAVLVENGDYGGRSAAPIAADVAAAAKELGLVP